jgi:hypothetical protein
MTLQEKLAAYKAQSRATTSPEVVSSMEGEVEDLRRSGALEEVLGVGDQAPHFALPDAQGEIVSSTDLLAKGTLVVSFYRGLW